MADYRLMFKVTQVFAVEADRNTAYTAIKAAIDGVSGSPTVSGHGKKWDTDVQSADTTVIENLTTEDL